MSGDDIKSPQESGKASGKMPDVIDSCEMENKGLSLLSSHTHSDSAARSMAPVDEKVRHSSPESKKHSTVDIKLENTEVERDLVKKVSQKSEKVSTAVKSVIIFSSHEPKQNDEDEDHDTQLLPVITTQKSKNRRGKRSNKKQQKPAVADNDTNVSATTSTTKLQTKKKEGTKNHLLTEYFPVRRSDRTSRTDREKMETKRLEEKILSGCEDGLKVVDIEGKGRGVKSTKQFRRGDFVVEYFGDLITLNEAQAKEDQYSTRPDVGCYMYYFKYGDKNYCIDATAESGKLGRLLNHSKSGNCRTKVVWIGTRPYLILVAARDIANNEELLYDYGDRSKEALEAHPWLAK